MSSIIHIFFHRCYSTPQHLMTYISGTPKCNSDNGCTPIYYRLDTLAACVLHGSWLLSCCCSLAWTSQRHCCCCSAPPSCTLSTWSLLMQFSFTPFECTGKNCPSPVVSFFFFAFIFYRYRLEWNVGMTSIRLLRGLLGQKQLYICVKDYSSPEIYLYQSICWSGSSKNLWYAKYQLTVSLKHHFSGYSTERWSPHF